MSNLHSIFWFRRDLRLDDNAGLYHALRNSSKVIPIFIFDTNILDELKNKKDHRVQFIHEVVAKLKEQLSEYGSDLLVFHTDPLSAFRKLTEIYPVNAVYTNHDFEPYARQRDILVAEFLETKSIAFHTFKDHVFFEKSEVVKDDGKPFVVFTPYSRKWKDKVDSFYLKSYPVSKYIHALAKNIHSDLPTLMSMGFEMSSREFPPSKVNTDLIANYHETRDIPSIRGTSRLGLHLRFGTISIRKAVSRARQLNEKFLNELIWRDFYAAILWHFPQIVHQSFKPEYDRIQWINNEEDFKKWCEGKTGIPLVDAGMRELNETGFMHNRVRMVVASFLTKNLLIDWRWGEAYFAEKLLDYDLASNNGGWQWAAGCGVDAAPYFRVFNPELQLEKFDPERKYVKQWISEFGTPAYPQPIVDLKESRERCLAVYKAALR